MDSLGKGSGLLLPPKWANRSTVYIGPSTNYLLVDLMYKAHDGLMATANEQEILNK